MKPVLIKLSQPSVKRKIFDKGKELYNRRKISVNKDLTRAQRAEKKQLLAAKRLFTGAGIDIKVKRLSFLWNDFTLNWEQVLDVYGELKTINMRGRILINYMHDVYFWSLFSATFWRPKKEPIV